VLWYKGRICVPNVKELKDKILHEAHESAYSIHLGGNKMYHDECHLLVVWYEERHCHVCCSLQHLSVSQSRASMTCWIAAMVASAWVAVGRVCHGFYRGFAEDSDGIQFHLGDCGSTDQGSSLYAYQDHLFRTTAGRVIYVKNSLSTWSVEEDYVK
jgi:hypothetical protein